MTEDQKLPVAGATSSVPTSVPLSPTTALDLSWMPEEKRAELLTEYARGMLDTSKKAQELHVDVAALKVTLGTLSETTRQVARDGNAATLTHSHTSAVGRTEIIMGNTEHARVGKLTKSQTGERDWTPIYVILGIIALVLIASAFAN